MVSKATATTVPTDKIITAGQARSVQAPHQGRVICRNSGGTGLTTTPVFFDLSGWVGNACELMCDTDLFWVAVESATPASTPSITAEEDGGADPEADFVKTVPAAYPAFAQVTFTVHPDKPFLWIRTVTGSVGAFGMRITRK